MKHEIFSIKALETFLNQNINNISQFEVHEYMFIIHLRDGSTVEIERKIDSPGLDYTLSKYRD